ncbi:hypothetical protein [Gulosibacter sp. 10]|uniref:hypothetical protein n=1 Tax=Gulosibacter sp. 10 TaxID=1255570 RepID=UPI00097EEA99|nr:hypothetical protein [Gulosibacter sp. 10]SJM66517.1 Tetratricopeptide TPR_2 [Gulosibacter sp. 10]
MEDFAPEAVRVRELLERAAALLQSGDAAYEGPLSEARALAERIADPASADDARTRIGLFRHAIAAAEGDASEALAHLDEALAAIGRQRRRGLAADRLDDHEASTRLARSRVLHGVQRFDEAAEEIGRARRLAPGTLDPEETDRSARIAAAAVEFARQEYPRARDLYARLAEEYRAAGRLGELCTALIGLAQSHARCGEHAEARLVLDRAEPLVADVDQQGALLQLRAYLEMLRPEDEEPEYGHYDRYVDHVEAYEHVLGITHRAEARKTGAARAHRGEEVEAARVELERAVADARRAGHQLDLATTLIRCSAATQDCALLAADVELHAAAIGQVEEARVMLQGLDQPLLLAAVDYTAASYLAQWHPEVVPESCAVLRAALERCLPAAVYLHRRSFDAEAVATRRGFAEHHARAAVHLACTLAFELGEKRVVAELVELLAAGAEFRGASKRGALLAAAPPPLRFAPDAIVLAAPSADAGRWYGGAIDARPPVPTW